VLGAVEVVRTLNETGIETLRDIEGGFFTEEEGVRTDMLGSAVTAGRIPLEHAHALTDDHGASTATHGPAPMARTSLPTRSCVSPTSRRSRPAAADSGGRPINRVDHG
jgi:hypothetical protein